MGEVKIHWQYFPKSSACPDLLHQVVGEFEKVLFEISSLKNVGQVSNAVLAKLRPGLEVLGFRVEAGKTGEGKIKVPVLFGRNGSVEKAFEADAFHAFGRVVLEVEAGRGVSNNQFLKDLFQACVMQGVDYAMIAVRNDYRGADDFSKVVGFIDTLYASTRLSLPLKGLMIIGY